MHTRRYRERSAITNQQLLQMFDLYYIYTNDAPSHFRLYFCRCLSPDCTECSFSVVPNLISVQPVHLPHKHTRTYNRTPEQRTTMAEFRAQHIKTYDLLCLSVRHARESLVRFTLAQTKYTLASKLRSVAYFVQP